MNVSYREIQYFGVSFYAIPIGLSVACGAIAAERLLTTGVSGFVAALAGLG